jgi:hypothetical protein
MDRSRALEVLRGGREGVARWNRWRLRREEAPVLSHADLSRADLSGADLSSVDLHASNLREAKLLGANLERADLHRCHLGSADLTAAILRSSNLRAANLHGAMLFGADLRRANLRRASFREAEADAATRWPQGFDPSAHGLEPWPAAFYVGPAVKPQALIEFYIVRSPKRKQSWWLRGTWGHGPRRPSIRAGKQYAGHPVLYAPGGR